jgi:hypothetical protein
VYAQRFQDPLFFRPGHFHQAGKEGCRFHQASLPLKEGFKVPGDDGGKLRKKALGVPPDGAGGLQQNYAYPRQKGDYGNQNKNDDQFSSQFHGAPFLGAYRERYIFLTRQVSKLHIQ